MCLSDFTSGKITNILLFSAILFVKFKIVIAENNKVSKIYRQQSNELTSL